MLRTFIRLHFCTPNSLLILSKQSSYLLSSLKQTKNQVNQFRDIEIVKNQVQIDAGSNPRDHLQARYNLDSELKSE